MTDIQTELKDKDIKIQKTSSKLYATGKRKNSIAKVWLIPNGKDEIKINKKDSHKYFSRSLNNFFRFKKL